MSSASSNRGLSQLRLGRPAGFLWCALLAAVFVVGGCDGCSNTPPDDDDAGSGPAVVVEPEPGADTCVIDGDCADNQTCEGGLCVSSVVDAGGGGDVDAGGGGDVDAGGPPMGRLQVLPDALVEFGAQRLGVPVERDVTVVNVGNAPLTVLTVILNNNETQEFAADPTGNLNEELLPGDQFTFRVSHTPVDGQADEAELNVLHNGEGNLTTVTFIAEFKGDPAFNIHDDVTNLMENVTTVDFGEIASDQTAQRRLYVRNTGRSDSLLAITDLSLTPAEGDFAFDDEFDFPILLSSWASGLCPDGSVDECPDEADACTDQVCVDADGLPLHALIVDLTYTPGISAATATLTVDTSLDGDTAFDVELSGTPTQPNAVVSPTEVMFGPALVGATSPEQTFELSNDGQGPLYVTRVEFPANDSAFVVEFNAPVPTEDGHPPLTLQPGAPPLVGTVTFTPEAAEGYTGFVTLHTNDSDSLTLPIGLSGTGVECPANAEVNAMGECVCSEGFNDCGGTCVDNNTLTACGASCTDCTSANIGAGTDAQCVDGTCEFTCREAYYDLDEDLSTDPFGGNWDGCEYLCTQQPALQFELCNRIDDNCDGVVDENLPPDQDDISLPNNSCASATNLGTVNATPNGVISTFQRTIYPSADNDWFQIMVAEGDDNPECVLDDVPCFEGGYQSYSTEFALTSPSGAAYSLEVTVPVFWEGQDVCASPASNKTVLTGASITHDWDRSSDLFDCILCGILGDDWCYEGGYGCFFRDYQPYWIRVVPTGGADDFSCEPYTLVITTRATGGT